MIIKQYRNLFLVEDISEIMILSYKLRLFQYYPCLYCIDVKFKGRLYIPKLNPLISSHSYFTLLPTVFQYFRDGGAWMLFLGFYTTILSRTVAASSTWEWRRRQVMCRESFNQS